MNCKEIQKEILDRLASGESNLPGEVMVHQRSCPGCRAYHEAQRALFGSIEQALVVVANFPAPPSLLPNVRARLEERAARHWFGFRGRPLARSMAAALVAAALVLFWLLSKQPGNSTSDVASVVAPYPMPEPTRDTPAASVPPRRVEARPHRATRPRSRGTPASVAEPQPAPEVIVLAEEQEAFAHFAAQVPGRPEVALALARPAADAPEPLAEIALLQMEFLEMKPLDPTAWQ
jgi:hypothetical protein